MSDRVTLYEAVQAFMGPISAEYGVVVEEGHPDMPVTIKIGGYEVAMTLAVLKRLDRAYMQAFDAKCKRDANKSKGSLL